MHPNIMLILWQERDYETLCIVVKVYMVARFDLANYGLFKFLECPFLCSQEELLRFFIPIWMPNHQAFEVRVYMLMFLAKVEIYFLTGFSIL
jgi:hypothetical protein